MANYTSPNWKNEGEPALSAQNLQNLTDAVQNNQILTGASAPTNATVGALGQYYMVTTVNADGVMPMYKCTGVSGGTYTWTLVYETLKGMISALTAITATENDRLVVQKDGTGALGLSTIASLLSLGGGAKIQTGSYVGTGTYGSANPCSLTFDSSQQGFNAKFLLLGEVLTGQGSTNIYHPSYTPYIVSLETLPKSYRDYGGYSKFYIKRNDY